jgi:deazaflavin-dependent oxidoreductase (nitroreductase family)
MTLKQRLLKFWGGVLKYTLNPLTRRFARTSFSPFSLILHVGRRSGKQYETPIIVARIEDGFVVELTYGYNVDWYKNVQAAGGCTIVWRGKDYQINQIEPLEAAAGRAAFPFPVRLILQLLNMRHFVKMTKSQ